MLGRTTLIIAFLVVNCLAPVRAEGNAHQRISPESRIADVEIAFAGVELNDRLSVQRQLVYINILSLLISDALPVLSLGLCNTVMTPSLYPNLRGYIFSRRKSSNLAQVEQACLLTLEEATLRHAFSDASVRASAEEQAQLVERRDPVRNPPPFLRLESLTRAAYRMIYDPASVMHALLSVDARSYRDVDVRDFLEWLKNARRNEYIGFAGVGQANDERLRKAGLPIVSVTVRPAPSAILPPADHPLLVQEKGGPFKVALALRYAGQHLRRTGHPASKKYCNRTFPYNVQGQHDEITELSTIRISCMAQSLFGIETWLVLYLDRTENTPNAFDIRYFEKLREDPVLAQGGNDPLGVATGPIMFTFQQ